MATTIQHCILPPCTGAHCTREVEAAHGGELFRSIE